MWIQCGRTLVSNPIPTVLLLVDLLKLSGCMDGAMEMAVHFSHSLALQTGCQWHRQCAFVYVLTRSKPHYARTGHRGVV